MQRLVVALMALCFVASGGAAQAAKAIGGYTNMSHDSVHGTQVEYMTPDGRTFLWYSGNSIILPGKWKKTGDQICFAYGANTYNPATGQRGGGWECMPFKLWWVSLVERMKGDVLALEGREAVPFKLRRDYVRLPALVRRVTGKAAEPTEVPYSSGSGTEAMSCASILANAEKSKGDMDMAASTIFWGKFMGAPCGKVDYVRAVQLARRAGGDLAGILLGILRERAEGGSPRAIAALKALGESP